MLADPPWPVLIMPVLLCSLLNRDQKTTLSDTTPPTPVRIVGITSDYGLLRSTPALTSGISSQSRGAWSSSKEHGQWIDLQPDGNRSVCRAMSVLPHS